jgi:choline dehydrogenase-like flavoprotein
MQPQTEAFDAIVVGSGISGGWAAKELTERGLRVLLLERGKDVEHVKDYPNARKAPWEYPHRGGRTHAMEEAYPVLKRDYPLNEKNLEWWANEKDSPYTEVKRFDWYRGYHVGGRSLTWGRQSYRLSDLDFEANAKEGIAIDWPIRYADLAPWYDHVERFAGVAGSVEGLPQLPDGQFQPAMPLNVAEERIAARPAKQFGGRQHAVMEDRAPKQRVRAPASPSASDEPAHYFRLMKELTLLGYFTSEIGCTQAMRYVESPGRFDPHAPRLPGDKSWASHA